jgi:hypothetical protein
VAHKERALTELNDYQRLDKMPKIVRLLAVDQEGGLLPFGLGEGRMQFMSLLPRFFFLAKIIIQTMM